MPNLPGVIAMTPGRFGIQDRKPVIGLENNFSFIIYNYAFLRIVREKLWSVHDLWTVVCLRCNKMHLFLLYGRMFLHELHKKAKQGKIIIDNRKKMSIFVNIFQSSPEGISERAG